MDQRAAADVFEIVVEEAPRKQRWFRGLMVLVSGFLTGGEALGLNPGGRRLIVRERLNGVEAFRYNESSGDDDAGLLGAMRRDLAEMNAAEFLESWDIAADGDPGSD